jgi:acyl-CoA thioesterase
MSQRLIAIEPTDDPHRFRLPVTDDICVGPPGNVFLFGGAGLAAAVDALKRVSGRELIWATAQYLSYARVGAVLDIAVVLSVHGRNVTQASAVARVGDEVILTVSAALGDRPGFSHQWLSMPDMPPPDRCVERPLWPVQAAGLMPRLEVRLAPGAPGLGPRDGTPIPDGRVRMWLRTREDHPVDAALLAVFADFLPAGTAMALGRIGGGNSLDNTLRLRGVVPTRWVLADVAVHAVDRGFGHGELALFAEDGTLLATAGQSMILRFMNG